MQRSSPHFFSIAVAFELSLAAVALLAAALLGLPLSAMLIVSPASVAGGVLATVPLLLFFRFSLGTTWSPLRRIRHLLLRLLRPLLRQLSVLRALLLGLAAGIGEELLFRGLIQTGLAALIGPLPALLTASAVFGVVHWITNAYALIATLLGVYFGLLLLLTESLIAPILAHALYDAVALLQLARRSRPNSRGTAGRS